MPEANGTRSAEAAKAESKRACKALLLCLAHHPSLAAVFWLALAHLQALQCLPTQVVHRLGYIQEPFVLSWARNLSLQASLEVKEILEQSLGSGLACLDVAACSWTVSTPAEVAAAALAKRSVQAVQISLANIVKEAVKPSSGPPGKAALSTVPLFRRDLPGFEMVPNPVQFSVGQLQTAVTSADLLPFDACIGQILTLPAATDLLKGMRQLDQQDIRYKKFFINAEATKQAAAASGIAVKKSPECPKGVSVEVK